LREVVGPRRWAAVAVGFVGVVIVAWPTGGSGLNIYTAMAVASAFFVAVVVILIRKLSQVDRPVTILTYQAVGVGILMFPPMIYFWKTPTFEEALILIAIGVLSAIGQTLNIFGLRAGEASAVAPLDYMRLLFAVLFGWLVFSDWPEPRVVIGAGLIVAAAVYTLHRERKKGLEERARAKIQTAGIR
ncbi:MAG: DMT family transporter, partial [Pseudomonadota bacterium]